jgi:hypothetical protein
MIYKRSGGGMDCHPGTEWLNRAGGGKPSNLPVAS